MQGRILTAFAVIAVVAATAGVLGGCGGEDEEPAASTTGIDAESVYEDVNEPEVLGVTPSDVQLYEDARVTCAENGRKGVAEGLELEPDATKREVAATYGERAGSSEETREIAEEGCLVGLNQ